MSSAKNGDLVFVHYTGKFDSGEVFDSSVDAEPLYFVIGEGNVIEGFEKAIVGMNIGDKKTVNLSPAEGYGDYSEEKIITVNRSNFGDEFEPEIDLQLALQMEDGERAIATVTEFDEENVTLDLNHPLAGKTLHFELELIDIKDASEMPSSCGSSCSSCSGCGH